MSEAIQPFVPSPRPIRFHIPPHIQSDFDTFLMTDIPFVNYTYEVHKNWYENNSTDVRGEVVPINWKSKYAGSDSATNLRISLKADVVKGDILIRKPTDKEPADTFMAIWDVEKEVNNKRVQIQRCNMRISFSRHFPLEIDPSTGMKISEAGYRPVAEEIPCIGSVVVNKLEYTVAQGTPGLLPNHMMVIYVQWNDSTKNIDINDTTVWHGQEYKVMDVNKSEVAWDGSYGLITLTMDKVAGGKLD